jgi:hypothetical protein
LNQTLTLATIAKTLGCSTNTVAMFRQQLGLKKHHKVTDEDVNNIKVLYKEWLETKHKRPKGKGKDRSESIQKALSILRTKGYCENDELLAIFKVSSMLTVHTAFESVDEPLYQDTITKIVYSEQSKRNNTIKVIVQRLFTDLKKQYIEENTAYGSGKPSKSGVVATNRGSLFL